MAKIYGLKRNKTTITIMNKNIYIKLSDNVSNILIFPKNVNDKWYSNLEPFVLQKTLSRAPQISLRFSRKGFRRCSWLGFPNLVNLSYSL